MRLRITVSWCPALVVGLLVVGVGAATAAPSAEPLATLSGDATVFWNLQPGLPKYDRLVLKVAAPDGTYEEHSFPQGKVPAFMPMENGVYAYELYLVPVGAAKRPDLPEVASPTAGRRGPKRGLVQAGSFTVVDGLWVDPATINRTRKNQAQRGEKP